MKKDYGTMGHDPPHYMFYTHTHTHTGIPKGEEKDMKEKVYLKK